MTSYTESALFRFAQGLQEPPYLDTKWQPEPVLVLPAVPQVKFGVARRRKLLHRITALASVCYDGRLRYGARWLCGDGSVNAIPVRNDTEEPRCRFCEDTAGLPAVYRRFDTSGHLLYIGSTAHLAKRLRSHNQQAPWWGLVAEVRDERHLTLAGARTAEEAAIVAEAPLYNRALNRNRDAEWRAAADFARDAWADARQDEIRARRGSPGAES